jgi:adenylate kinase
VGITGTPATGKKTVGRALAAELGVPFLSLNEVAAEGGLVVANGGGEPRLDAKGFMKEARRLLPKDGYVLAGVFIPESVPPALLDYVVVLRCNPLVLAKRYEERGYPERKKKENLTAEFLDACLGEAVEAFGGKVREVDVTGRELPDVLGEVKSSLKKGRQMVGRVDWLGLIKGPGDVLRFLT